MERAQVFKEREARTAPHSETKDTSLLSRVLRAVWIVTLVVIVVDAGIVLFSSPDIFAYLTQRETFYAIATWGTVIYFATAYWELRRGKAHAAAEHADPDARSREAEPATT